MTNPSEYSNIGEDYMLDEQERQTRLSNDMIDHIEMREAAPQEEQMALEKVLSLMPQLLLVWLIQPLTLLILFFLILSRTFLK